MRDIQAFLVVAAMLGDNFSWQSSGEEESLRTALFSVQNGRGFACPYLSLHCQEKLPPSVVEPLLLEKLLE